MTLQDTLPVDAQFEKTGLPPTLYLVVFLPTMLGVAHHVDHILRGNHVGWPVTHHVNEFTYSLSIYPLIGISLVLAALGIAGWRYWTGFFTLSAAMLAYFHVSPWAIEPPQDVIDPYANPLLGYVAFVVLLALIGSTVAMAAYTARRYYRGQSA